MDTRYPAPLAPGGTIGVVSPSGPVRDASQFQKGVQTLEARGFKVQIAPRTLGRVFHMSASGREKAEDLNAMFADPAITAIFPSVGGHTANQVLEYLDYDLILRNPKLLVGFSDNSIILNAIYARTGLVSIHDCADIMFGVGRFGDDRLATRGDYTARYLFQVLENAAPLGTIEPLSTWQCVRAGIATGFALGGNLSTLRALIGSPYEPEWSGAVLFLEDRAEPHQWDQQLGHLRLAGVLERLCALVIGKVENKPEEFYKENYQPIADIVARHCAEYGYPIVYGADFGHDVENFPIPIGVRVRVNGGDRSLTFLESATRPLEAPS
jgi:muramoyltetrapeptide carboxypeptidase